MIKEHQGAMIICALSETNTFVSSTNSREQLIHIQNSFIDFILTKNTNMLTTSTHLEIMSL